MLKKIKILGLSMGVALCVGTTSFPVCCALKNKDNNVDAAPVSSQRIQLINEVEAFNQEGRRNNIYLMTLLFQASFLDIQRYRANPNSVSLLNLMNVAMQTDSTVNINAYEFNPAERQLLTQFNEFSRIAIAHRQRGEVLQRRVLEIRNQNHNAHL